MEASRELDVQIARDVMGLRPCHFMIDAMFSAWATAWRCRCATTHQCYPENKDAIEHAHSPLRKYSSQLEAAWEVLVQEGSRFLFVRRLSSRGGEDFRLCRDYPVSETYWLEYMTPGGLHRGPDAKTPALAICLAAIDATKSEKRGEK
jgi:hypothetical protein